MKLFKNGTLIQFDSNYKNVIMFHPDKIETESLILFFLSEYKYSPEIFSYDKEKNILKINSQLIDIYNNLVYWLSKNGWINLSKYAETIKIL